MARPLAEDVHPYRIIWPNYCYAPWSTNKNVLSLVYFLCKAVKLVLDSGLWTNERCVLVRLGPLSLSHTHTHNAKPNTLPRIYTPKTKP